MTPIEKAQLQEEIAEYYKEIISKALMYATYDNTWYYSCVGETGRGIVFSTKDNRRCEVLCKDIRITSCLNDRESARFKKCLARHGLIEIDRNSVGLKI